MDEDDMTFQEAAAYAVDKRKFLLDRMFTKRHYFPDSNEEEEEDTDTDEEEDTGVEEEDVGEEEQEDTGTDEEEIPEKKLKVYEKE